MIELSPAVREFVVAFADDEHLIGAHHATWIGVTPFLEEDLAFCSIAQDELGHALSLYELVTDDVDRFAILRDPVDYRSCWFVEASTPDWADALVRHWLHDLAEAIRWSDLVDSTVPELASLARTVEREEAFHRRHADQLLSRLVADEGEARSRITEAVERQLALAVGLFDPVTGEAEVVATSVTARTAAAAASEWQREVTARLAALGIEYDWPARRPPQDHRRVRHPEFPTFHAELGEVLSIDPSAIW